MLDIKFIRENKELIKNGALKKGINPDIIDKLLKIDEERRYLIEKSENIRANQKKIKDREEGKRLKEEFKELSEKLKKTEEEYNLLMIQVPTPPSPDTPLGKDEKENKEIFRWGKIPQFKFKPKTHIELGKILDILDFERGVKVSGFRGYYLKNEGVLLAMGLMMYALEKMIKRGYQPLIPPTLVKDFVLFGSGYFKGPKYNPETDEVYRVYAGKEGEKFLIGTAEPSLLAYYANEFLKEEDLPVKLCGFSQCYRSEIGSYSKDIKGIYRVHEFMKVEQVVFCPADVDFSNRIQEEMIGITKELHEDLGLPYRLVHICTGDLSTGKYKQIDYEVWMPGLNRWGETGSASNFLDWQARRLNVRYKTKDGEKKFVFMLNNTAMPTPRPLIAILENYQQKDGSVLIPSVLQKYVGKKKITPQKRDDEN